MQGRLTKDNDEKEEAGGCSERYYKEIDKNGEYDAFELVKRAKHA